MASNVSAVSGSVANGHQTLALRFHKPPCDPGRWAFLSPVLTLDFLCGSSRHYCQKGLRTGGVFYGRQIQELWIKQNRGSFRKVCPGTELLGGGLGQVN